MSKKWAIIGAGRQGPAAAFDLGTYGDSDSISLADYDIGLADAAAKKVASAPYKLNPLIMNSAIDCGVSAVDMGIDTPDALNIHKRFLQAVEKGISIVTDCGIAPGLVNILAMKILSEQPKTRKIQLYCGGLPQSVEAPYFHKVGFSVDSLIGEYIDDVESLVNGKVQISKPLEGFETTDIVGFGKLEAVTTSGGTGTAPYSLKDRLEHYEYKTLRYPGHWKAMIEMRDSGAWSEDRDEHGQTRYEKTVIEMEKHMVDPSSKDVVVTRVVGFSPDAVLGYDFIDRMAESSPWTAMQRTTGFSTAIVAQMVSQGRVPSGCFGCESAVDPHEFFKEAEKRGFELKRWTE